MTDCCCVSDMWDEGVVKSSLRNVKRARKAYFCCECERMIPPGAPYRYETALMDGRWYQYRTCTTCAAIRDDRFSCGWTWGTLWEDLRDCLGGGFAESWLDPPRHPIEVT